MNVVGWNREEMGEEEWKGEEGVGEGGMGGEYWKGEEGEEREEWEKEEREEREERRRNKRMEGKKARAKILPVDSLKVSHCMIQSPGAHYTDAVPDLHTHTHTHTNRTDISQE